MAPLILGALALAVAVYVYILLMRSQKELKNIRTDLEIIATHLDTEMAPAFDRLRSEQEELKRWLLSPEQQMSSEDNNPGREDIAEAMLRSIVFQNTAAADFPNFEAAVSVTSEEEGEVTVKKKKKRAAAAPNKRILSVVDAAPSVAAVLAVVPVPAGVPARVPAVLQVVLEEEAEDAEEAEEAEDAEDAEEAEEAETEEEESEDSDRS